MGNESSDFDSTISASALAWYLHTTNPSSPTSPHYVPLINVPRRHFHLRAEILAEYTRLGLDPAHVSFIDDVDLRALAQRCDLRLVLTDHNRLAASQAFLGPLRRRRGRPPRGRGAVPHQPGQYRVIGKTGSCCTHVVNLIQDHHPALLSSSFALYPLVQLLTDVILVDTHNMAPELGKGTRRTTRGRWSSSRKATHAAAVCAPEDAAQRRAGLVDRVAAAEGQQGVRAWGVRGDDQHGAHAAGRVAAQQPAHDRRAHRTSQADRRAHRTHLLHRQDHQGLQARPPPPRAPHTATDGAGGGGGDKGGKGKLTPEAFFAELAKGLEADDALRLLTVDTTRPVAGLADGERSAVSGVGAVEVGGGKVKEGQHGVLVRRYDQKDVSSSRKQVAPRVESILSRL